MLLLLFTCALRHFPEQGRESGGVSASTCRAALHSWSILLMQQPAVYAHGNKSSPITGGSRRKDWEPPGDKTPRCLRSFHTVTLHLWGFCSEASAFGGHKHMCGKKQLKPKDTLPLNPQHLIPQENFSGSVVRLSWGSKGNYRWPHSQMGIYTPVLGSLFNLSLTYFFY